MFHRYATRLFVLAPMAAATTVVHCQSIINNNNNNTDTDSDVDRRTRVMNIATKMQRVFVNKLRNLEDNDKEDSQQDFQPHSWLRDNGLHGGGTRFQSSPTSTAFKQATVNVSSVHFHDLVNYPINSATALSVIVHPKHPLAPSLHFHISYMEPRTGPGYWRMIADLNPAALEVDRHLLEDARPNSLVLKDSLAKTQHMSSSLYKDALEFGDKYFYIPSLGRHRGVYHMFICKLHDDEIKFDDSCHLAEDLALRAISTYVDLVQRSLHDFPSESVTIEQKEIQLAYHTLYLYQVLTLDRGTTHGLMAHDQNDVGTMGSLPPAIDRELLAAWMSRTPSPQDELLQMILDVVPNDGVIDDHVRKKLAKIVRTHYRTKKEARDMQAELNFEWWKERTVERLAER